MKLSKGAFLPLYLNLFNRGVIDASFLVFVEYLFISNKKEGFNSKINNITLTADSIVDWIISKAKISS